MDVILGVDIGGTDIKLGILSPEGEMIIDGTVPTEQESGVAHSAEKVRAWYEENASAGMNLVALGIGCAGLIDREKGTVISSPNLPAWVGESIKEEFESALGVPVVVENDANCAAFGEYKKGSGEGADLFVCITLGTGVGGGIVVNGGLFTGGRGFAGEIGHIVIDPTGPECACGKRGCLEAFIGSGSIVRMAIEEIESGRDSELSELGEITVKAISEAAGRGDEVAVDVLSRTGGYLGMGLSIIAHLINPDRIAVGGGVSGAGEFILAPARERFGELLMHEVMGDMEVVPARLGNSAAVIGASLLAVERFVTDS